MRLMTVLLAALLSLASGRAYAAADAWTADGPDGAFVKALVVDPRSANTVYAGTDGGGVFKTVDGGVSWSAARSGLASASINALALAPVDPDTLYAASDAGIFRSFDAGLTWTQSTARPDGGAFSVSVDPGDARTVYTDAPDGGILKSTNGGDTWVPMNEGLEGLPGLTLRRMAIDPARPDTLYAATTRGLFKSVAGGAWSPASTGLPFANSVNVFAFDSADTDIVYVGSLAGPNPSSVYKTVNGGGEWIPTGTELGFDLVRALFVDPTTPATVYALGSDGVYKSIDGADHWALAANGLPPRRFGFRSMAISADAEPSLYVGMEVAEVPVFRSSDRAQTWQPTSVAQLWNTFVTALAIDSAPEPTRYVTIEPHGGATEEAFRLLKKAAGDATWHTADAGLPEPTCIVVDPHDPGVLYAGTLHNGVFRSENAGESWRPAAAGLDDNDILSLTVDPATRDTVYACGAPVEGGALVYKTTSAGAIWLPRSNGLQDAGATRAALPWVVVIDPTTPARLYAGTDQGVFTSANGGNSWQEADQGISATFIRSLAIDPTAPATIYAGANQGGLFKSVDGAANWETANGANGEIGAEETVRGLLIDSSAPGTIYAATESGVFRSRNGGGNWTPISEGLFSPSVRAVILDPQHPTHLFAGTYGAGVFTIALACDGDCDGNRSVTADELVRAVGTALGERPLDECPSFDINGDGRVDVSELVQIIGISLRHNC